MVSSPFFLEISLALAPSTDGVFLFPKTENNVAKRLTQNKRNLVLAFLQTRNATSAYLAAYPHFKGKRETAASNASRILKEPEVEAYLQELGAEAAKPTILKLSELGEFWTQIIQDAGQDIKDRLSASRTLAQYAFKFFEKQPQNGAEQDAAQSSGKPLLSPDFASFCESVGYFRPYPKQVEMAEFVRGSGARLLLGARGYGKTDYGVICGIAWALLQEPSDTWLIITKEEERGKDILAEIARVLEERGVVFEQRNSKNLRLAGHAGKDPNVAVLPLRSRSFRGRHPKHIVCDDLITPDDTSAAERARVEKVREELMKLTDNVVFIGQPAHAKDVYAKMRKLAGVKTLEVPYGSIPELDCNLEAQRAAGISEASIQASYFLKISESERLPFAAVEYANFFPSDGCAGFIDPSHEGNDYTALALVKRNFDLLIIAGFAWQKAWDDCLEEIVAVMRAFNCQTFAFETNGVGKHPVMVLRQAGANVQGWRSDTNKHARIMNAAAYRQNLRLAQFLPPDLNAPAYREAQTAFNDMVVNYEYKAEHDDAPDALANLLMYVGVLTDEHKGHF